MFRQLQQRFDAELHKKVLELLEQESQEFLETKIEQSEEARQKPDIETREHLERDNKSSDSLEAEPTSDFASDPERTDEALAHELFEAEDALEFHEVHEQTESTFESSMDSIERHTSEPLEVNDQLNQVGQPYDSLRPHDEPIDLGAQLFAGIDDVLESIEPIGDLDAIESIEGFEPTEAYEPLDVAEPYDIIEQALNEPAIESLLVPEMLLEPLDALEANETMDVEVEAY
jgi:hypothetical protein